MSQSDQPTVSVVRCGEVHDASALLEPVREAFDLIGGLESVIMAGDTVLLKPNLVSPVNYENGAVTNPHLVEAVAILCEEAGARHVVIGDGACVGASTEEAFDVTGLRDMAARHGYELVDFTHAPFQYVVNPLAKKMRRIRLPQAFLEANVVIDMPVMKTHDVLEVSLGVKNMKGLLQTDDKKRFHKWGLVQSVVDLIQIAKPDITLVDGTIGMEGSGPTWGEPVGLGLLLASKDVVAADTVAAEIMGYTLDEADYIRQAAMAGVGCCDMDQIQVLGLPVDEVRHPFRRSSIDPALLDELGIELYPMDACSGCANAVQNFLIFLANHGRLEEMRDTILLYGQSVEELPPEATEGKRVIRIGSCTRSLIGYGHYFPGCPPFLYPMLKELGLADE